MWQLTKVAILPYTESEVFFTYIHFTLLKMQLSGVSLAHIFENIKDTKANFLTLTATEDGFFL